MSGLPAVPATTTIDTLPASHSCRVLSYGQIRHLMGFARILDQKQPERQSRFRRARARASGARQASPATARVAKPEGMKEERALCARPLLPRASVLECGARVPARHRFTSPHSNELSVGVRTPTSPAARWWQSLLTISSSPFAALRVHSRANPPRTGCAKGDSSPIQGGSPIGAAPVR